MIGHAFVYFNFYPQHDSLNHAFDFAREWEISLGRFFLIFLEKIKGNVSVPWIEGIGVMLCISLMCFVISDILQIKEKNCIVALSGFLSINPSIIELNGVFDFVSAAYMFSSTLALLGVYIIVKYQTNIFSVLISILLFTVSVSIYQGGIASGMCLFLLYEIKKCVNNDDEIREKFKRWFKYFLVIFVSLCMYFVLWHLFLKLYNIQPANSYNSSSNLKNLSVTKIPKTIIKNYILFFDFFYGKGCFVGQYVCRTANIIFSLVACIKLVEIVIKKRINKHNLFLMLLLIVLIPLFCCAINVIIQKETLFFYCNYSICFQYIFLLSIINEGEVVFTPCVKSIKKIYLVLILIILFQNIILANEVYTSQKILYDRTVSIITRVLDTIENCPEYKIGHTKVVLVGDLYKNPNIPKLDANLDWYHGSKKVSVTYKQTFESMAFILGSNINRECDEKVINQISNREDVKEMEIYPGKGYCKLIDDVIVVKLSN